MRRPCLAPLLAGTDFAPSLMLMGLAPAVQTRRLVVCPWPLLGLAVLRPSGVARAERLDDVRVVSVHRENLPYGM